MYSAKIIRSGVFGTGIGLFKNPILFRHYSSEVSKKKKKTQNADISQVPIKSIGVIADYYVPPRLLRSPILSWPRLIARRLGVFAINTYSVVKFRRETGLKLTFDLWKDNAIEEYVRVNKVFAASCSLSRNKRADYIRTQLNGVAGTALTSSLVKRALTFPSNAKLDWELLKINGNPRVVSFNALPDNNNVTALVQFVLALNTKQRFTISTIGQETPQVTERDVKNYLVYTLDPFAQELVLVGSLFEANHVRGVQPEISFTNSQAMVKFQTSCADIYRSDPLEKN